MSVRRKIILCITIVFCCVTLLAACTPNGETPDSGGGGGSKPDLPYYWKCKFIADKEEYDINDVTITFIYGYGSEKVETIYFNDYNEACSAKADENEEYPPVAVNVYFLSFGNEYLIKTVEDFFSEEYLAENHREEITIPSTLFYNEYGLIKFHFAVKDGENGKKELYGKTTYSWLYYKKEGNKVRISNKDFAPEYQYHYLSLMKHGFEDMADGFGTKDKSIRNYCAVIGCLVNAILDYKGVTVADGVTVDFYFGRLYDAETSSVDIYIVTQEAGQERKTLVRTVDDYASAKYKCRREYDYNGEIREIIYNHTEKIYIPLSLLTENSGEIKLCVCETESGNEISSITFAYEKHADTDIHLDYYVKR